MTLKPLYRPALAAVLLAAMPLAAAAVTKAKATPTPAAVVAAHLANLKTKGSAEIDRRLSSLNVALTKLGDSTKLVAADKTTLTKQVQDEITSLNALKTKLTAETDLAAARADVTSIVADYRVYVLMLPKVRLVSAVDHMAVIEDKLTNLAATLQAKIDAEKAAGHSTTSLQSSLNDLTAKVAAAKTTTTGLSTSLMALQPADYNATHTVLAGYRTSLATTRTQLGAARDDAKTITAGLKALH